MAELRQHCGLPVVWRGCQPFSGGFDHRRLRIGWALSWCVFACSLALLIFDWLSQRDKIAFGSVFGTFALSAFVLPLVEMLLHLGSSLLGAVFAGRRPEASLWTAAPQPILTRRQPPPRGMPPPEDSSRGGGAHNVNAGAVLRSRQAGQARRAPPAESAAVLIAAQGIPPPPPPPQPAVRSVMSRPRPTAPAQLTNAPPPAAPAQYPPRGEGAAVRRQLRVAGSGGGVRGQTMTSRAALRPAAGLVARPPLGAPPPPRERNTINLGNLDGAPPSGHEGEHDPRLEAHRWLHRCAQPVHKC